MISRESTLIVIPTYNEEMTLASVIKPLIEKGYNCLVVNDDSNDSSALVARECGSEVISLPFNLGVGGALRVGFQFALRNGFEAVIQIDADGQHPLDMIDDLVSCTNTTGAHLVVGSRFISNSVVMDLGLIRRSAMWLLAKSASHATGQKITDSSSGFRLIRRPLLDQLALGLSANYLGDTYEAMIAAGRAKYKVVEMPVVIYEREFGESSATWFQALNFTLKALGVWVLQLHRPIVGPIKDRG
jgi:glycosyltransferase involved in cell wall biosynthesis